MNQLDTPPFPQSLATGLLKVSMLVPVLSSCATAEAERFLGFFVANQRVYMEFCRLAEQMRVERQRLKYSADVLFHVLRWHRDLDTNDPDYTINNDHNAYYARAYMHHYDCDGWFETRKSKADLVRWPDQHRGILRGKMPVL